MADEPASPRLIAEDVDCCARLEQVLLDLDDTLRLVALRIGQLAQAQQRETHYGLGRGGLTAEEMRQDYARP